MAAKLVTHSDEVETRPFAGIWREWEGDRGTKTIPNVGKHMVFSFLTTDASPDVAPIHPDATPVLLLDEDAREMWMNAPWELAQTLQGHRRQVPCVWWRRILRKTCGDRPMLSGRGNRRGGI